jgi:hypothetical protein
MNVNMRLPGFTAESSARGASFYLPGLFFAPYEEAVVSAGSDVTCNCGCPCGGTSGGGTSGGTGPGGPGGGSGTCQCSSVAGIGCSVSSNNCNPGFTPVCNCGLISNSCQCVPGT